MLTKWGESLDQDNILSEYPRPQLQRGSYLNLNGYWDYAITDSNDIPTKFDGKIVVPFSPEAPLSQVNKTLAPDQSLWYHRQVALPHTFHPQNNRLILHFDAVDYETTVFINQTRMYSHVGGYLPFSVDVSQFGQEFSLHVLVHDPSDTKQQTRGKQKTKRGGIWYTAQSGIWQTVWMESIPQDAVDSLKIEPLFDDQAVAITVGSRSNRTYILEIEAQEHICRTNTREVIHLETAVPWSPEHPHLYPIAITLDTDVVNSYFALRKFSVGKDATGKPRLMLNNLPYFHNGVLDQGYWPDGLYTQPSDEAMIFDIQSMKDLGFNMLRKHIKVEPLRWYYHCDTIGMLVWQDMINGGGSYNPLTISTPLVTGIHFKDTHYRLFARTDEQARTQFISELKDMIRHLYNCPCIAMWVPFNEGWGQFDSAKTVHLIKELDTSRTIDHASGWHDQKTGDFKSLHVYFKPYRFKPDSQGRTVILTEFGGYSYPVPGHCYSKKQFGYKVLHTGEALFSAYKKLYEEQIIPAISKGLAATVYTQLSDVEDEVNGFLTYDRKVLKLPLQETREISRKMYLHP